MNRRSPRRLSEPEDVITSASADGVIAFRLVPRAKGIHVERIQLRTGSARVIQSMLFQDDQSFIRWCDADQLKFSYPLVYANLRRNGSALLAGQH
jgi:hypothetical protein